MPSSSVRHALRQTTSTAGCKTYYPQRLADRLETHTCLLLPVPRRLDAAAHIAKPTRGSTPRQHPPCPSVLCVSRVPSPVSADTTSLAPALEDPIDACDRRLTYAGAKSVCGQVLACAAQQSSLCRLDASSLRVWQLSGGGTR
ncbi:hypothetical protein PsYK624_056100 [Phanerochaete sordida]|uniref:Uncharacterized protein n=1 Tax=Phanerochaete sordida TaxID=48140 RepID=A0A9P3G5D6_9APHY|nr:hypothetical protein PsYK624_056100 [Phanerochaete sordida]